MKFRMGITNTYNSFYREILDERELNDEDEVFFDNTSYLRLETKFVINLFNEIGYSIDEIKLKKEYIDFMEEYFYYYSIEDVWSFIQRRDDEYFYGVMVYLSQTSTTNKILLKLQQAVKDELLRNRISIRELRKTVFIAMSFASEMDKPREAIMRAIEDKGYKAIVIDEKEHNEQIVPQIFEEINRAEFVIADLTGHRNGVYYEAGFAKGLNKQVIFTCRADDFGNSHFDVKQINTIRWENEWILEERLRKRIEAMMTNELEEQHVPF
ncbi:hypothetical protein [Sporosarcina koreensis]|uniref:Nucleoside 2-deoxyribosyltransferase n=1 Tax=Sporosarcina koreensis TaxID=334735 RepID=A0ABW0TZ01_9BACL